MKGIVMFLSVLFLSAHFLFAEAISLKGTVKNAAGKGIADAKVTLAKVKSVSVTTDAQGAFTITGPLSVQMIQCSKPQFHLSLAGNVLAVSPIFSSTRGCVDVFSSNGKKIVSTSFNGTKTGNQSVNLPEFSSGLNVIRVTIGTETITRMLVCLDAGNRYLKTDATNTLSADKFSLAKSSAATAVDTLIVTKSNYTDKKTPLTSYSLQDLNIVLDSATTPDLKCSTPDPKLPAPSAITYSNKKHPSPWDFKFMDLPRVTTMAQWQCRRQEIYLMAQEYLYGHMPPKCEVKGTVSGGKITATCTYNGKTTDVSINASGSGDILILCFGGGCTSISGARSVNVSGADFLSAAKKLYGSTDMGICMASAWGAGRIIDALEQNPDCGISAKKVVTSGCSTNGKQALFAGVFEPRVGLCAPVESGAAGACSWRVSSEYGHGNSNTDCQDITHLETNWTGTVTDNTWEKGNPTIDHLPLDQGEIMALRAPNPMISFDNGKEQYKWLCNRGNTAAAQGCHWIYKALGVEDNFGFYQANAGHTHCGWPSEATPSLNAFVDKFLKGNASANTHVFNYNKESMDTDKWFDFGTEKEQWDTTLVLK